MFKFIDIELTTHCNAKCQFCIRTEAHTKPEHIEFDVIKKLPIPEELHLIGIRGDNILYPRLFDVIRHFSDMGTAIRLHTNASVHPVEWWKELAGLMKGEGDDLIFALDGLEDTHHLYRKGTDYKKIIRNVSAFIAEGNTTTAQVLVFKHNQHQLEDIKTLLKDIGVRDIWIRKSRDYNDELQRPTIEGWKTRHEMGEEKTEVDCGHINIGHVYLRVDGQLRPCCFMGCDQWENPDEFNLKYHSFDEVYYHPKFEEIRNNYRDIQRCQEKCRCVFDDIVNTGAL